MNKVMNKSIVIPLLTALMLLSCLIPGSSAYADDGTETAGDSTQQTIVIADPTPVPQEQETGDTSSQTETTSTEQETGSTVQETVTPAPAESPAAAAVSAPVITKNPTNENLSVGGKAVFVAKADSSTSICWYIIDADGSKYPASELASHYNGISVYGADTVQLVIDKVTLKMSGLQAYALFTNEAGTVSSTAAALSVIPAATATATPTAAPTAAANTTAEATATPAASTAPTAAGSTAQSAAASAQSSLADDTEEAKTYTSVSSTASAVEKKTQAAKNSSTVVFILFTIAIVVIIACVCVLILYKNDMISLEWLEDLLSKKRRR